jgi:hypothetical protein
VPSLPPCIFITLFHVLFWVLGVGFWVLGSGYWVLGSGCSVLGDRQERCPLSIRVRWVF